MSFKIIDEEAGAHGFSPAQWSIVQRMIHTSADFEHMKTVRFHPEAIKAGIKAIREGRTIVTDTNMARAGIRKKGIQQFGGTVVCLINDPAVGNKAAAMETTRAKAAVDAAISLMKNGIYVIGNAPTALFRLIELIKENKIRPALVIGLPVGFVNAAESKTALLEMDIPYISNVGRKGGSNIAAAVVNALIIMAAKI